MLAKYFFLQGFNTTNANTAARISSVIAVPNTGCQLPVFSCISAASGPPRIDPIPCEIYSQP